MSYHFDCRDTAHALILALRNTKGDFRLDSLNLEEAAVYTGTLLACAPQQLGYRCRFYEPASFLRVRLSPSLVAECYRELAQADPPPDLVLFETHVTEDKILTALVQYLVAIENGGGTLDASFIGSIGLALAGRLVGLHLRSRSQLASRKVSILPTWRLSRVTDYIEAHIQERIPLTVLADVGGLSRMHFAAAFRAATGVPPHLFVLQRKIERSKLLLAAGHLSIAEISRAVGVSSQSHFTSLFRRVVGVTPHRWQAAQRNP